MAVKFKRNASGELVAYRNGRRVGNVRTSASDVKGTPKKKARRKNA